MKYIALSGGADSVYLLLKLTEQAESVTALHCNFHLRGAESDRDENFCRTLCERLEVEIKVRHFDTKEYAATHHLSIEMAARELRYTWFAEETDTIHVAHHRDDQAETILMNIMRGTGLKGLVGMSKETTMHLQSSDDKRQMRTLRVVRPLLSVSKEQILKYLEECGQDYVTDSTNMERDALRNRIRLDLLPLMKRIQPKTAEHICRMAENAGEQLEATTQAALHLLLSPLGFNRSQIKQIAEYDGKETREWKSATHHLIKSKGKIAYEELTDNTAKVFRVDEEKIHGPLFYRRVRPGDRFRPFGMKKGTKLVNDYLSERGVNLLERRKTIVAHNADGQIVWVVDHEIDDRFRVDDTTRKVMTLTFS